MSEEQLNASIVGGRKVRITKASNGATDCLFDVTPGATHAIMEGDQVSVFYRKGGVKVYSKRGSFVSMSGDCSQ